MRYDLSEGFPLVTTKDMMTPNKDGVNRLDMIIHELLWFLDGDTDVRTLLKKKVNIWNRDAYQKYLRERPLTDSPLSYKDFIDKLLNDKYFGMQYGDLGPIYGHQWRNWEVPVYEYGFNDGTTRGIDQISNALEELKNNPDSRRIIVQAWNVGQLEDMGLPPCHVMFQFYVADGKLHCMLTQRSADVFLGVPFNIASYSLLTMMMADQLGLGYGEFIHTLGDGHIYLNHVDQVKEQISREPKPLPKLTIAKRDSIFNYRRDDFTLTGYESHSELKGKQSS